jgi:hypothetical protein
MKRYMLSLLLLAFAYAMSGCSQGVTSDPTRQLLTVEDQASLIKALEAAGATTEVSDSITQDFFNPEGRFITINGAEDIQVFEYENADAMENDASQVAPDGGSIGTSMVDWIDTPHFYKSGRIIVLYIGNTQTILTLLEKTMGHQFAGR